MKNEDPADWQQTPEDDAFDDLIVAVVCILGIIVYFWLKAWT